MRAPHLLAMTGLLTCVSLASCTKKSPSTSSPAAQPAALDQQLEAQRQKQPRMGDCAVYVDGKSLAVMRFLEMPSSMKPITRTLPNGYEITRYGMASYLKALGIDLAKVKGAHFYGGRRVGLVAGDELRELGDKLQFSFTQKDHGKPRIHRAHGMKATLSIDMLTGVVVYVDKEPPALDDDNGASVLIYPNGQKVKGVPYADEEQGNGTRVYVDGALKATLKRKTLPNAALLSTDDAHPRFSLPLYLASMGVVTKNAKAIDFVAGDTVVARNTGVSDFAFSLPAKSQGKAVFEVPKAHEGETAKTRISAIQLYVHTTPPARTVVPPEQDDVPGPNNNDGRRSGGPQDEET